MPRDGDGFTVEDPARARPTLDVVPGEIDQLATEAEAALLSSDLPIFQRGEFIVVPVSHEVPAARGQTTLAAGLKDLSAAGIIDHLAQAACFQHWNIRAKKMTPCNPPALVANVILSRSGRWKLPSVAGVITTPTLRPNGSLLTAPGYDPATRLYHVPDPELRLPVIPAKPTLAYARAALEKLNALLAEFPFVAEVDRAVALSGLITPVLRGMLPVAPLHAIRASTAGTGKSFLVDLASALSTGRPCPVLSAGKTEEETEKRLVGALLSAVPIISIDNVNGEIGGDQLCHAVERPLFKVRRLGFSDDIEIESRATFFATGNGLHVRGDMVRRTIICSLDANVERPELRIFDHNPLQQVLDDRGAYVAAALSVVRAYLEAGQPDRIKPALASFDDWSNTVRSALVWLGCADPVVTMEAARDEDPELATLRQVIGAWQTCFEETPVTVAGLISKAAESFINDDRNEEMAHPKLREALRTIAGEKGGGINPTRLGKWIQQKKGRVVSVEDYQGASKAYRINKYATSGGSVVWQMTKGGWVA